MEKPMTRKYTHEHGPHIDLDTEDVRDSRGRRITEAYVEDAVADAHRQVRGRPSLTALGGRSPQIAFRVRAELQAGAEKLAAQRGTTVSQLAREALETYLAAAH
jgi:hypothetical protein